MTFQGTIDNPFTLAQALVATEIQPGHTIYLRGGVYYGNFVSELRGTASAPITIRPYQDERPIIDGSFDINGAFTIWRDLEIRYSGWTTRTSAEPGNVPSDLPRRDLNIYGPNTRMINCTIHDLSNFGWWGPAIGSELYGCLIYSNGWTAPDRGHGHGVYTQNNPGGGKVWRNCITWGHYATCGKVFSAENAAPLTQYAISGLICGPSGDSRILLGSEEMTVSDCMTFGATMQLDDALGASQIAFDHLYVAHDTDIPLVLNGWGSMNGTDNTIIGGNGSDPSYRVVALIANRGDWELNRNSYFYTGPNAKEIREESIADRTFVQWQLATGLDANSTLVHGQPTINKIVVQSNAYDTQRAHVAIWNWEGLVSVAAPIAGTYTNAQNPAESVVLAAGAPLPMSGWTVVAPIAGVAPLASWNNRFAVFVVTS